MADNLPVRFKPRIHRPAREGYRKAKRHDLLKTATAGLLELGRILLR